MNREENLLKDEVASGAAGSPEAASTESMSDAAAQAEGYKPWEEKASSSRLVAGILRGVSIALNVVSVIIVLAWFVMLVAALSSSGALAAISVTMLPILLILLGVFTIAITVLDAVREYYIKVALSGWIKENNFDYAKYIKKGYSSNIVGEYVVGPVNKKQYDHLCSAAFLSVHPENKGSLVGLLVSKIIIGVISFILAVILLFLLYSNALASIAAHGNISGLFSGLGIILVILVVDIILAIVRTVIKKVLTSNYKTALEEWIHTL